MTIHLVALHGFLGRAADWDGLAGVVEGATLHAVDLWKALGDEGARDWASAISAVDRALLAGCGRRPSLGAGAGVAKAAGPAADPAFVVAYSFGARLALGSRFLSSPGSAVRGCCFVSCNPGLADDDRPAREARRVSDEVWAGRILSDPEDAFSQAWDAQPAFDGSGTPATSRELPASRDVLARALSAGSLAGQPDLRPRLRAWPTPVLWVTGARDRKFEAMAGELRASGMDADFVTCEDAGHRVPWDNPPAFAAALRGWIARVMENER